MVEGEGALYRANHASGWWRETTTLS